MLRPPSGTRVTATAIAPIARALARATTTHDVARLRAHRDVLRDAWRIEYDNDVLVTVQLSAKLEADSAQTEDVYVVELECSGYNILPPTVRFVDATTRQYRVGETLHALPRTEGLSGFQIHPTFTNFSDRARIDQLVCFSFSRGYYESGHTPQPHEQWRPGHHWLYTTLRVLHRVLQAPYYKGRMG